MPGSLVLIGGDPGIGKSTLMLQIMSDLSEKYKVLYVSGEESANQIKLRADRTGVGQSNMLLYPETDMHDIREQINDVKPDFVVIDSIQTMNEPSLDSMTGSASQVREVTSELMKIARWMPLQFLLSATLQKRVRLLGLDLGTYGGYRSLF